MKLRKRLAPLKKLLFATRRPTELLTGLASMRGTEVFENAQHLRLAADWLLRSQEMAPDGAGYSRGFYLSKGWDKGYIETTGYIIPTMLQLAERFSDETYRKSALDAGKWLLSKQNLDGSFCDIDRGIPLAFDTGQVLYGLLALAKTLPNQEGLAFQESSKSAALWLCEAQDPDGSWTRFGYNGIAHSYYSRVASALYQAGKFFNDPAMIAAAEKNIAWVISQQKPNGFFNHLRFEPKEVPFLHTMSYVLEGLLEVHAISQNPALLQSVLRFAEPLKKLNLENHLLLPSQISEDFHLVNPERCMTGLAQWATLCLELYSITQDQGYLMCGIKTFHYLKAKQLKTNKNLKGSLLGSLPIWGEYCPFAFNNWPVKFYADGLLKYEKLKISPQEESTTWGAEVFRGFFSDDSSSELSKTAYFYLQEIETKLKSGDTVLDLGCGEGKAFFALQKRNPEVSCSGIDPFAPDTDGFIKKGDCYNPGLSDCSFSLVYTVEVLQHVRYLDMALKNIHRILKPGGLLMIGDRNTWSVLSFLKPILESLGKWMYPADSAFYETWRTRSAWEESLKSAGFEILGYKSFTNRQFSRIPFMNRYFMITARKTAPGQ